MDGRDLTSNDDDAKRHQLDCRGKECDKETSYSTTGWDSILRMDKNLQLLAMPPLCSRGRECKVGRAFTVL